MRKLLSLLAFFSILLAVPAQSSLEEKISEMMELTGSDDRFDAIVDRMLASQLERDNSLGDEFYERLATSLKDSAAAALREELIPIYAKYLSEDDLDDILLFYKSEAGHHLLENQSTILNEAMDVGEKIGAKIGFQVYNAIQADKRIRFDSVYTGCEELKVGEFVMKYEDGDVHYVRTKNRQTESYNGFVSKYEINWLDGCRYTLKLISTNNPSRDKNDETILTVNIISFDDWSYKYLAEMEGESYLNTGELIRSAK